MNNKCIYYVEGPCEQQLIAALKEAPERLIPGKIKVFNVVQNLIPKSQMLSIQAGTTVVLVFDTDVSQTSNLKKNLELLTRWYVAPTIINTFLEAYDFSGKKIVLFATSGGSGFGNTVKELQPSAPEAVITEGSLLNRGTKQKVSEWVNSL